MSELIQDPVLSSERHFWAFVEKTIRIHGLPWRVVPVPGCKTPFKKPVGEIRAGYGIYSRDNVWVVNTHTGSLEAATALVGRINMQFAEFCE